MKPPPQPRPRSGRRRRWAFALGGVVVLVAGVGILIKAIDPPARHGRFDAPSSYGDLPPVVARLGFMGEGRYCEHRGRRTTYLITGKADPTAVRPNGLSDAFPPELTSTIEWMRADPAVFQFGCSEPYAVSAGEMDGWYVVICLCPTTHRVTIRLTSK